MCTRVVQSDILNDIIIYIETLSFHIHHGRELSRKIP